MPRFSLRHLALSLLVLPLAACNSPLAHSSPTATPPVAYAALGASETWGSGAEPHTRGYAYQVAHALHATRFADEGIPGTTLVDGYRTELRGALAIHPTLASLFFGFNDLAQGVDRASFLHDLRTVVTKLQQHGCRVLIIGLPDLALLPAVQARHIGGLQPIITSWNASMAGVARETHASFLNLAAYSAQLAAHPEYVSADGLHPSNVGHTALAHAVVAAIRKDGLWRGR